MPTEKLVLGKPVFTAINVNRSKCCYIVILMIEPLPKKQVAFKKQ